MQLKKIRKARAIVREFASPKFVWGAVSGLIAALILESFTGLIKNTLKYQEASFYLVLISTLSCLVLTGYFLDSIQQVVENRNYTRFITSKRERLALMTECIKRARKSIYVLSDLSDTEETQLPEHEKYLDALNKAIKENKGNPEFEVKRIIVPSSAFGMDGNSDPNWIYKIPVTGPYLEHFELLRDFDRASPKHKNGPRHVSIMLIDNRFLFWKPELTFDDETLDSLLDGGIYLEDYSREGMSEFKECFRIMYDGAQLVDLKSFALAKKKSRS